jgi:hypothetical protein
LETEEITGGRRRGDDEMEGCVLGKDASNQFYGSELIVEHEIGRTGT